MVADGGSRVVHPYPDTNGEFVGPRAVRRRGLSCCVPREKCEGMVLTGDIVHELLAVDRQVAVGEMIAGRALVTGDPVRSKIVRGRRGSLPT